MKKIILIDDSVTARFLIKKIINESGMDCSITEASDGIEAYTAIKDSSPPPDIIITSLNLRKMSGITLLKKLKKSIAFDRVSLVIIAETGHEKIRELLDGCVIAGILEKPVDKSRLFKILSIEEGR